VKVSSRNHIAYAEQNPLIMSGTVRSNIIFGAPFDKVWYETVVKACALIDDFKQLSNGDLTKLGEMGIQLSGG
jgi:ABC-type bacteriocin/lantibiotic exporter with double-glycine peptidase domain